MNSFFLLLKLLLKIFGWSLLQLSLDVHSIKKGRSQFFYLNSHEEQKIVTNMLITQFISFNANHSTEFPANLYYTSDSKLIPRSDLQFLLLVEHRKPHCIDLWFLADKLICHFFQFFSHSSSVPCQWFRPHSRNANMYPSLSLDMF